MWRNCRPTAIGVYGRCCAVVESRLALRASTPSACIGLTPLIISSSTDACGTTSPGHRVVRPTRGCQRALDVARHNQIQGRVVIIDLPKPQIFAIPRRQWRRAERGNQLRRGTKVRLKCRSGLRLFF